MQAPGAVPIICPLGVGIAIPFNPLSLLSLLADQSIDLKGLCIFCLDKADFSSSFELQKFTQSLSDIWPYIQPNWNDNIVPGYTFVVGKALDGSSDVYSNIPPMCVYCKNRISKVITCHQEILELRKKIQALESDVERCASAIRKRMSRDTPESPPIDGRSYKLRYESLMEQLRRGAASGKVLSNTVEFLNQLRGPATSEEFVVKADPFDVAERYEEMEVGPSLFNNSILITTVQEPVMASTSSKRKISGPGGKQAKLRRKAHDDNECEVCDKRIREGEMYSHLRSHVGEIAYPCPNAMCNTAYLTRWSSKFTRHCQENKNCMIIAKSTNCLQKVCEACSQESATLPTFGKHLKSHENKIKNFKCPLKPCKERFTLRQSLEYHLHSTTHNFDSLLSKIPQQLQKCSMPSCSDVLLKPDRMIVHLKKAHKVEKIINCKYCSFVFPDMEELVLHVGDHIQGDYASVTCDICCSDETLFFSVATLREHYFSMHGIGKTLCCEQKSCNFTCFTNRQLARHMETCRGGNAQLLPVDDSKQHLGQELES